MQVAPAVVVAIEGPGVGGSFQQLRQPPGTHRGHGRPEFHVKKWKMQAVGSPCDATFVEDGHALRKAGRCPEIEQTAPVGPQQPQSPPDPEARVQFGMGSMDQLVRRHRMQPGIRRRSHGQPAQPRHVEFLAKRQRRNKSVTLVPVVADDHRHPEIVAQPHQGPHAVVMGFEQRGRRARLGLAALLVDQFKVRTAQYPVVCAGRAVGHAIPLCPDAPGNAPEHYQNKSGTQH